MFKSAWRGLLSSHTLGGLLGDGFVEDEKGHRAATRLNRIFSNQ
jgi:hypothetical protein